MTLGTIIVVSFLTISMAVIYMVVEFCDKEDE